MMLDIIAKARAIAPAGGSERLGDTLHNYAVFLVDGNEFAAGEQVLRECVAMREAIHGERHPKTAASLEGLAIVMQSTGRAVEAEPIVQRVLALKAEAQANGLVMRQ